MSINRNDKCPCGSDNKYKKCCMRILPVSSKDYLNNNFEMINFYKKLYQDEVNIDWITRQLTSGIFSSLLLRDLFRYRVFIDSLMLLFNKEKLEKKYFRRKIIYKDFFEHLNSSDHEMKDFLDLYRRFLREKVGRLVPMNSFYVPYSSEETRPYDQLARVRNAFAHMNYGHFEFLSHGEYGTEYLIGYSIYNKDKETNKSKFHGFILEPVLHYFIQSYFSNYTSYGIVYKHTWFSLSSMSEYQYSSVINEYTDIKVNVLTYAKDEKYTGNSSHEMISFTKNFKQLNHEEIMGYIKSHSAEFKHSIYTISKEEFDEKLKFVQSEVGREVTAEEFCYSIKFLYDFETEFSNFLVHLMQLNDRIIDYISPWIENSFENKDNILSSIEELKEDKYSWLAFKYMFPILSVINICLRFEDDDLFEINPKNVDIEGFVIDNTNLERFMEKHPDIEEEHKKNVYILERLRNSVAHGHIHLTLKDNSMSYQFTDIYNNRSEQISISYFALNQFIDQSVFKQRD